MCKFCHEHGEGKKWYLQAKNYAEDLQSDLLRRMNVPNEDAPSLLGGKPGFARTQFQKLGQRPRWLRSLAKPYLSSKVLREQKERHFGQVIPIEDAESIFDMVNSIVRVACVCRRATIGRDERYCYGISMGPAPAWTEKVDASYLAGPDTSGLEVFTKDEAMEKLREHEREGCIHSVWTLPTPFIVGICNCDRSDCGALRSTLGGGVKSLFKAEYIAAVDPELCNGCRQCMRVCQYGAMGCSAAQEKVVIDPLRCAGCGICRLVCKKDAITLSDRAESPVAAAIW